MRYPTLQHTLQLIKHVAPQSLNHVIDVGAQRETPFLLSECPDSIHHLFEPVTTYHEDLVAKYESMGRRFKLYPVALSDHVGEAYLHNYSEDNSGRVTHSYLNDEEEMTHSAPKVSRDTITVTTLDAVFEPGSLATHEYLIKLDVDGIEEKIIDGGARMFGDASFIIIEASLGRRNVISRLSLIESLGYRLFDIGDQAYYFAQMSQCDLVFINEKLRAKYLKFRPWEMAEFKVQWQNWQHGFSDLEEIPLDNPFES